MSAEITRRRFLEAAAGAGLSTALWRCAGPAGEATRWVLELVRQIAVPDPLAVGAAYWLERREMADAAALLAEVFPEPGAGRGPSELAAAFGERLREDFRQSRTVEVDGWVLSQTEARFCALLTVDYRRAAAASR